MEAMTTNTTNKEILFPRILKEEYITRDFSLGILELEINITDRDLIKKDELIAFLNSIGQNIYNVTCTINEVLFKELGAETIARFISGELEKGNFKQFKGHNEYILFGVIR